MRAVAWTLEGAVRAGHVRGHGGAAAAAVVEGVTAPTLAAVLDTSVELVRTGAEALIDGHVDAVVDDLRGEETADLGLGEAAIVGEVLVAWGDDGACRGRLRGGGARRGA